MQELPMQKVMKLTILIMMHTKKVKIAVPLKYLCNFWRTLDMPVTNCQTNWF